MSFYVGTGKGDQIKAVRVGTNGSQYPMIALFLAAYGVGGFAESRRVRGGWVQPDWSGVKHAYHVESLLPSLVQTIRDMKAWIGYNVGDCTWLKMEEETIERGLKIKSVTDPALALLVKFRAEAIKDRESGELTAGDAAALAPILRELMPHLQTSCWVEILEAVTAVFEAAAEQGEGVRLW